MLFHPQLGMVELSLELIPLIKSSKHMIPLGFAGGSWCMPAVCAALKISLFFRACLQVRFCKNGFYGESTGFVSLFLCLEKICCLSISIAIPHVGLHSLVFKLATAHIPKWWIFHRCKWVFWINFLAGFCFALFRKMYLILLLMQVCVLRYLWFHPFCHIGPIFSLRNLFTRF